MAKKKNREPPKDKKNTGFKIFLAVLTLIILTILVLNKLQSTKITCSKHPEKCTCEIKCPLNLASCIDKNYGESKGDCLKYRLKTQEELAIEDCNNNPRNDSGCKCTEVGYYQHFKVRDPYEYREDCLGTEGVDSWFRYCKVNSLNETFGDYQTKCVKSRPLTECEKENPEWIEENRNKSPTIYLTKIGYDSASNETICRVKTPCERRTKGWTQDIRYGMECKKEGLNDVVGENVSIEDLSNFLNADYICTINKSYKGECIQTG